MLGDREIIGNSQVGISNFRFLISDLAFGVDPPLVQTACFFDGLFLYIACPRKEYFR